jgi:hypothetical protein
MRRAMAGSTTKLISKAEYLLLLKRADALVAAVRTRPRKGAASRGLCEVRADPCLRTSIGPYSNLEEFWRQL